MRRALQAAVVAAVVYVTNTAVAAAGFLKPGSPQAPPGSGKAQTVMNWFEWVCLGVCVAGIMMVGATLALEHRHASGGGGGGAGSGVIRVLIGVILVSGGGTIVGALVS